MNIPLRAAETIKNLSAFYTPPSTAASLASWAVRTGRERVLEPSFGGGALLEAALNRSIELTGSASLFLAGMDIDEAAVRNLKRRRIGRHVTVQKADFLDSSPAQYETFDAILSNPPFTRNHSIPADRRAALRQRFSVSGAAGLWVHFILHSLNFLKDGGRIACVVPASALFTGYGSKLLRHLCSQFTSVEILRLNERPQWIGDADESGAFLLAEGYREGACLEPLRGFWVEGRGAVSDFDATNISFTELCLAARSLQQIADLSIGDVTGCNRVFLLSEKERLESGIARADVTPIVSRARQIRGVLLTKRELVELASAGEKTWLLTPRELGNRGSAVRSRLAQINASKRLKTAWLNKREPWWKVHRGPDCDAVFSYMNDHGPRLARVTPGLTCTNTLHRVRFRPDTSEKDEAAAILTIASTFGQLAGERLGRVYGGGVLKFELRDARQLPVLPIADETYRDALVEVDTALREGRRDRARHIADKALLPSICGPGWRLAVGELEAELLQRRSARRMTATDNG